MKKPLTFNLKGDIILIMSNLIHIRRITETASGNTGAIISDDYGADFSFFPTSPDDLTLIAEVFKMESGTVSDYLHDLAEYIIEHECGILVDGTYYGYGKIKGIVEGE